MKARKEEETRKGMRRFAATDDPRPMSVSLRPQNKQLSMKDVKKGGKPGGAKYVLREMHEVFSNKNSKKEFFKKKKSVEICSVFEIKENENPKKGFEQTESTNKDFLTIKKGDVVLPFLSKKRECFSMMKVNNRKEKMFQKKEKRRQWRWDDVDRGLRPCRSPHNTIFTTHAIWFFTTLSGWFHQGFSYEWWEKASPSRQDKMTPPSLYCILQVIFHSFWTL